MPAAPDFRLYHSNALDVLAGLLAEAMREPAPGQSLLVPDIVLIPQAAMKRWLQATLAQQHGVAANIEFLTPGEFVQRALAANPDPDVAADAGGDLDAEALQWRLHAALTDPAILRLSAMKSLKAYLQGGDLQKGDPLKPWSLAGELAAVFEKYQAWRRDWLLGWEAGRDPNDPQAELWRRVAGGRLHRARRIGRYLERFAAADAPLPAGLPPRLFAFATLNVSPDVLRVIATQARVGILHFYMPNPTGAWWGDMQTLAERLRAGETLEAMTEPSADTDVADTGDADVVGADVVGDNPLLQAWGAAGRDFVAVLGSYEVVHPSGEIDASVDPEANIGDTPFAPGLLRRLQSDLFHRRARPSGPLRPAVDPGDPSLQIHACHTRLREVQVLHDQLRGLLDDPRFDPPLQSREIAVLAPDIDPYTPHIEAVFGGRAGQPDFIPYALADNSPLAGEPLAGVFLRLLELPISRFGLNEILDLLASPPLAAAVGLDTPALERVHDWLQAAGARWAIDAAHRARHQAPADDAYTWAFALDRLLLGHASGDERDIAGIAPWTELEGGGLDALDALLRLLRVLARFEKVLGAPMTPDAWRGRLLALLDAVLPSSPSSDREQRALERLRRLIDDFAGAAARAGFDQDIPPEVVRAHFAARLGEADTRAPLLTGGVSFGRMVPMRLLPFRVIAVLGMNDGDYPRRDPAAGLNRLTADVVSGRRRHGDRSLREDDRFLFLQLFAAASDVFYLSYLGADPRDGSAREPSVLVSELIEAAADYHEDASTARKSLVVPHPLQPFAPAAFGAGERAPEPRRFSYRREWHPAADRAAASRVPVAPWISGPLPVADAGDGTLPVEALRRFLCDPAGQFLRQRLDLRLPDEVEANDDIEPLVLPVHGLHRSRLQKAVFDACTAAPPDGVDSDALAAHLRAGAMLPSGPMGRRQFDALLGEIRPYAEAFAQWRGADASDAGHARAAPVEIDIDGLRLQGRVADIYPAGLGRVRIGELNGPAVIRHGLDWLLLCAAGQGRELVQFDDRRQAGLGPHLRAPIDVETAREALRRLLQLRAWGLREPLPFAPYTGWTWYEGQTRLDEGASPRANSKTPWERAQEQWHAERGFSEGATDALRLALRGRDPFADEDVGEDFRAIARIVFDAVCHGHDRGGEA